MSGGLRNGTVRCRQRPTRYQPERAVLVNYACHAVVLGPNSEISADYPGAMQRFVEQALGSEATVLFTNGAEGDSNPIIHPGSRDDVDLLGQRLGAEVLKAVDNLELRDVRVLRMSRARVSLPLRRRLLPALPSCLSGSLTATSGISPPLKLMRRAGSK